MRARGTGERGGWDGLGRATHPRPWPQLRKPRGQGRVRKQRSLSTVSDKTLEAPPLQKALPIRSDSPLDLRSRTPGTSQQACKATRSSRLQSPVWLAQMCLHGTPPWGDPRPSGEVGVPAHRPAGLISFLFPAPGAGGKKKMSVTPGSHLPPPSPFEGALPLRKPRPR